ncbi:MAG: hypothetical protein K8S27_04785 [Candidatus Omnitrophica bacterium]|nr:hypothetical protein [Candidatus Omnitrophota bacterium]
MSDGETRYFLFLFCLAIVVTVFTVSKKLRYKIFKSRSPVYKLTFDLKNGQKISLEDVVVIVPQSIVMQAVKEFGSMQKIPRIDSKDLTRFETDMYNDYDDNAYVKGAIKTFRAWHAGFILKIVDPLNIFPEEERSVYVPKINEEDFQDFIYVVFMDINNAETMPETTKRIRRQFDVFLAKFFSDENEFLISWAERCLLTNKRVVIMTNDEIPDLQHSIPLDQIVQYTEIAGDKRFVA